MRLDNGSFPTHWYSGRKAMGSPTQSGHFTRFNRTYRTEVLDCYIVDSLHEVLKMTAD